MNMVSYIYIYIYTYIKFFCGIHNAFFFCLHAIFFLSPRNFFFFGQLGGEGLSLLVFGVTRARLTTSQHVPNMFPTRLQCCVYCRPSTGGVVGWSGLSETMGGCIFLPMPELVTVFFH